MGVGRSNEWTVSILPAEAEALADPIHQPTLSRPATPTMTRKMRTRRMRMTRMTAPLIRRRSPHVPSLSAAGAGRAPRGC